MNPDQPLDSSSMSLTTSPAHDVAKLMGRRSLSNIPKDQRSLLELENSWAVDLKDGPHGLATVPSHVLKTLKEAFIRLKDENEKENPKGEENLDIAPITDDHGEQNGYSPSSTPARSNSAPRSSPEIRVEWSQSPARPRAQQHIELSDAGSPIDEASAGPSIGPLSQPPLFHATPSPSPSSSASEPEDLEMELPQAQEKLEAPTNRVAAHIHLTATPQEPTSLVASMVTTTDTPPCAQPLVASVPCTSSETPKSSVLPADPVHGRSRRMKAIDFSEDSPRVTALSTNPAPLTRMPSMRAFPAANIENSSSLSSTNSGPYNDGRPESFPSPPPPTPPPHNFAAKDVTPQTKTPHNRTTGRLDEANSRDISPFHQGPVYQLYRIQAAKDVLISDLTEPYGAFTATYPEYATVHSGNLMSFVQACVYLEILQKRRAIREYLYDDFIRAWSSQYLSYVHNAGPGQEPLPAVEWFNTLKGAILFNRMCVNAGNIDVVLNAYPEETARSRAVINAIHERDESLAQETEPDQGIEMELEQEPEPERERHAVDLLDSDNAMDSSVAEESRPEPQLPPPTRQPPSLPPPSRAAPPPPPRPLSPELGSDNFDFDSPTLPLKSQSAPKPHSRSRSRPHTREPLPHSKPRSQPQPQPQPERHPQLQPQREMTLPQRHSPKRHSTSVPIPPVPIPSSTAPPPSTTRRSHKSSNPKSSPYPTEHVVSRGRSVPSSGGRAIPKPRKRSDEERARMKEHFRKKASSSSTSFIGSGEN